MSKFLGIFYKEWYMWLHYLPSVLVAEFLVILIAKLFGMPQTPQWYILTILFFVLYIGIAITDQFVHAFYSLFGIKD